MNIKEIFEGFSRTKILVVGDVMIDRYLVGKTTRISPEAPVPVVHLNYIENRLGGAANVALNIQALGGKPILCSVVGEDNSNNIFINLLEEKRLPTEGIVKDASRVTTVKTRILSKGQQLLRFDEEDTFDLSEELVFRLLDKIEYFIQNENIQVILFQDYNKGVLCKPLINGILKLAGKYKIKTTVDPKINNFWAYKGVTLFKPNLKEILTGLNRSSIPMEAEALKEATSLLREKLLHQYSLITLSSKGLYIESTKQAHFLPTRPRQIADVCGAGDAVIAVTSLALAQDLDLEVMGKMANMAGGIVCEEVGVVPIRKEKLWAEMEDAFKE